MSLVCSDRGHRKKALIFLLLPAGHLVFPSVKSMYMLMSLSSPSWLCREFLGGCSWFYKLSASCLLGRVCSQDFFFSSSLPSFLWSTCPEELSGCCAPPHPPSETASLCCQHVDSGVRQGEWDSQRIRPLTDPVFQDELFSENFEGFESKLGF